CLRRPLTVVGAASSDPSAKERNTSSDAKDRAARGASCVGPTHDIAPQQRAGLPLPVGVHMAGDLARIGPALISVSDKTGLYGLGAALAARGIELISTGGTAR